MATSLSTLAQFCAEAGFDLFDEDLGPHWGQCVAAWLASELPFEDDAPPVPPGDAGRSDLPGAPPPPLADGPSSDPAGRT